MQSLYAAAVDGCAAFDSGKIDDVVAWNVLGELAEVGGAAARPAWHWQPRSS